MENSELQDQVMNLGKLFVKELNLEPGVDTFSRWMAHYLAEKISTVERTEGEKREVAQKECFDVILKLWQHRHSLPRGRRPLQSFESIIELLSSLHPDKETPFFYYDDRNQEEPEPEIDNLDYKPVEEWIDIVKDIDKIARVWIEYALNQAATKAKDERTKEWVENAINLADNGDTTVISMLFDDGSLFEDEDEYSLKKYHVERLGKRIAQLRKYAQLNGILLNSYEKDLESILKNNRGG